ncbi:aminoglycoside phosphotransferase family protein [Streptomyces sp. NPDC007264]|uniref:aminoglycoside phosphotransferase family protein n=1 Tax=Streptomyces sp. NPDC007264 TaxID=3364777 RepID=UPI0036DE4CA6
MRHDASTVVDRGRYEHAVTPWERDAWRKAALGWAQGELEALGLRVTGLRTVRLRPWSVLVRMSVAGRGAVWFKANPPGSTFEAALGSALAQWVPEHVLEPLSVDPGRGWSLLPDGGERLRDVLDRGRAGFPAWEQALRQYAAMQHALVPHTHAMERLGVPSARTASLPDVFDRLVAENSALHAEDRKRLRALRPRLVAWCTELAGVGIADSLDHADLHDAQMLVPEPECRRFTFFDWGDAAVSHPFCSLLVPARAARDRYGADVLPRLRDAYLEPWTGGGRTAAELRRATTLAWRLGALGRACSWGRVFPGVPGTAGDTGAAESAQWLRGLFTEPPAWNNADPA